MTAVARDAAFTEMVVEYVYDEMGQRIMKKTYNSSHHLIQNIQLTPISSSLIYGTGE
ncbi:hypothetical protein [uncultured Dysgonomonas sp.]|uniref:hypothetical protein n=1 Tax=uncultured Dysgonomonas sp. TaxID=206096 RepID=UPI0026129857|nr:hypothetical protein [uncultured Dysgonomonas sp.]